MGCFLCPSHPILHPSGHWGETGLEFGIQLPSPSQIWVRPLSHLHPHQKEEARSLLISLFTQLSTSCLEGPLSSRPEVHCMPPAPLTLLRVTGCQWQGDEVSTSGSLPGDRQADHGILTPQSQEEKMRGCIGQMETSPAKSH